MYYPMYWGPEKYIKCCNKTKSGEWRVENRVMETERLQRESYKRNTSYAVNLKMLNTSIWIVDK